MVSLFHISLLLNNCIKVGISRKKHVSVHIITSSFTIRPNKKRFVSFWSEGFKGSLHETNPCYPYSLKRWGFLHFRYLKCLVKWFISPDHKDGYFWGVYVTGGVSSWGHQGSRFSVLPRASRSCWQDTYWPRRYSERNLRKGPQKLPFHETGVIVSHSANGPWKKKFELYFPY